jgi:transposase
VAQATVAVVASLNQQIATLEEALGEGFQLHPDAKTIRSLPGLGMVLGARVLGEFGDDPTRFPIAKSRKNYAGSAPITKASGRAVVVLARHARNRRLADALEQWAFCSLTRSPGARRYYDQLRHETRPTAKRCGSSPTDGSASSTPVWNAASSMTNTWPGATSNPLPLDSFHTWDV